MKAAYGRSYSSGSSAGRQSGHASGMGTGGTDAFRSDETGLPPASTSESWSEFSSSSESESDSFSAGETISKTLVPMLVPVLGQELSHVQFRSLDEQLFRAMAVLFDQEQRQGVARLVGMSAPVSIFTPDLKEMPGNEKKTKRFLEKCYRKLPFALPAEEARRLISERAESFAEKLFKEAADEPVSAKRKIR